MLIGITCSVYVLLACLLTASVLMQKGKGFGAESSRGSGFSGTYFGSSGAESFMKKVTVGLVIALAGTGVFLGSLFHREAQHRAAEIENGSEEEAAFEETALLDKEDLNLETGPKAELEAEASEPEALSEDAAADN